MFCARPLPIASEYRCVSVYLPEHFLGAFAFVDPKTHSDPRCCPVNQKQVVGHHRTIVITVIIIYITIMFIVIISIIVVIIALTRLPYMHSLTHAHSP